MIESQVKQLRKIHTFSLIFLITVPMVLTLFLHLMNDIRGIPENFATTLYLIALVLSAICVLISMFRFRKSINAIPENENIKIKLQLFRSAFLIGQSPLGWAFIFDVIVFEVTRTVSVLILPLLLLVVIASYRPSVERVKEYLKIRD